MKVGSMTNDCKDFSQIGRKEGLQGQHAKVMITCVKEMKMRDFSFFFQECTPTFPPWVLEHILGSDFGVVTGLFSPCEQGKPNSRTRCQSFCYNKQKVVFHGCFAHFKQLFLGRHDLRCRNLLSGPGSRVGGRNEEVEGVTDAMS